LDEEEKEIERERKEKKDREVNIEDDIISNKEVLSVQNIEK